MTTLHRLVKQEGLREWTKKLGQQHFHVPGTSNCLCGMPMLGNNYAMHIAEEDKTTCDKCHEELAYRVSSAELNI